jgi:integrase
MATERLDAFLATLPRLLRERPNVARRAGGGRRRQPARRRILAVSSISVRATRRLLERLDSDEGGISRRTGKPSWPESWEMAVELARHVGAEAHLVLVLASWLERQAETTRRTYWYLARGFLVALRATTIRSLALLPHEAALAWQRDLARQVVRSGQLRKPRSVNTATAALNSLLRHVVALGVVPGAEWLPVGPVKVTRGRHEDVEPVVLTLEQLVDFLAAAARRPRRVLLAAAIMALHGARRGEVSRLQRRDVRSRRRGSQAAPAVFRFVGKGQKPRLVQVHPAMRTWIERHCEGLEPDTYLLAGADGHPPSPGTVSAWMRDIFQAIGLTGYAHALRASWTTIALESKANDALQVQQSGGWKDARTMTAHYFKRRQVPLIRLTAGRN